LPCPKVPNPVVIFPPWSLKSNLYSSPETISLDIGDVDLERSTISILGKGDSEKIQLTIPEPVKAALIKWLDIRGDESGPLFTSCDRAGKGSGRISPNGIYKIIRKLGGNFSVKTRPHGIRHSAITEAVKVSLANGIRLDEALSFSRHSSLAVLNLYPDQERDMQGQIASLVSADL
jgi:integrase/recombinase XerC